MASAKLIEAEEEVFNINASGVETQTGTSLGRDIYPFRQDSPPQYSGNPLFTPQKNKLLPATSLPPIDLGSYRLPCGALSEDKTACITTNPAFYEHPAALFKLLKEQAALPPNPVIRVRGTHVDWVYTWGNTRADFDLTLDIMPLILPAVTPRPSYTNIRPLQSNEPGADPLRSWVQQFCDDPSQSKRVRKRRLTPHRDSLCPVNTSRRKPPMFLHSFILERQVTNWDTCFLEREIRRVVMSTKYQGTIEITFPILHSKVVILRESTTSTANVSKDVSDVPKRPKWLGRSKALVKSSAPEISKPPTISCHADRTYDIVQAVWPYAANAPDFSSTSGPFSHDGSTSRCLVQSEQDWFKVWKEPIRNGILNKKQGWVTLEDWKETMMGVQFPEAKKAWGTSADDWHLVMKNIRGSKAGGDFFVPPEYAGGESR